ncbi:MAG: lysophospholipase [Treponema sp.]|jgi:alpha-beta hydrolase superfamily lysophospholipase|nr:lysophospholipase [Treponema sp.]
MVQDNTWFESSDGTKLYLRRWLSGPSPALRPVAVVHIVHGMAEHGERYGRLAEKLCGAGIEVWAADQRGHGKTADLSVNDPGKGGLLGHCADKGAWRRVTADINSINREIRTIYPNIPLFLLGHSWGSFIVQNYIEEGGGEVADLPSVDLPSADLPSSDGDSAGFHLVNGCILSGTRGPGGLKVRVGKPFLTLLALVCGQRRGSSIARATADGSHNRSFHPNRTFFDWLSRDEAEVDAYVDDPLCGSLCSAGFYRDLVRGLSQIHRPGAMARIRRDMPIYIFSGSADPVGEMGASPTALVNAYRSLGIKNLEFVLYPGARHETLNETNRDEVMNNLLSWICRHTHSEQAAGKE